MRLTKQDNKTVILESRLFRTHYSRNSDVPVRLLNQPKLKKSRRIIVSQSSPFTDLSLGFPCEADNEAD